MSGLLFDYPVVRYIKSLELLKMSNTQNSRESNIRKSHVPITQLQQLTSCYIFSPSLLDYFQADLRYSISYLNTKYASLSNKNFSFKS